MRWDDYGNHMGGWGWGAWVGMALMMLLFWLLLVAAVVLLVRYARGDGTRGGSAQGGPGAHGTRAEGGSAESVLAERYARGEIDEEEYLRRRSVLRGT